MQNRLGVIFIKRKQLIIFILAFVVVFLGMNYFKLSDNFLGNKKYVYVLGNVVGIRANTEGVLVLGYEDNIQYIDKLKEGDNILYINDEKVKNAIKIIKEETRYFKLLGCYKKKEGYK